MGFINEVFPSGIADGARFALGFNTAIHRHPGGQVQTTQRWEEPLARVTFPQSLEQWEAANELYRFYIAVGGAANSFLFKAPSHFTSAENAFGTPDDEDVSIGTGDNSTTTFQLVKKYTYGSVSRSKVISKPKSGTVICALDGVSEAGFSVDHTTGKVTFDTAPGDGVDITAGFEFYFPMRFDEDSDEALTQIWRSYNAGAIENISLFEEKSPEAVAYDFNPGGSKVVTMTTSTLLMEPFPSFWVVGPNGAHRTVIAPDPTVLIPGINQPVIKNSGGTFNLNMVDSSGASIGTVGPGELGQLFLEGDDTVTPATRTWHMIVG